MNKEEIQDEMDRCKDPVYFYEKYCLVNGKKPILSDSQKVELRRWCSLNDSNTTFPFAGEIHNPNKKKAPPPCINDVCQVIDEDHYHFGKSVVVIEADKDSVLAIPLQFGKTPTMQFRFDQLQVKHRTQPESNLRP